METPAIIQNILKARTPRKLRVEEFPSRRHYYWAYQYMLANLYLCPLLEKWGFDFNGKKVLDVGCGSGGIACAMMDHGAKCDGVDINDLEKPYLEDRPFRFVHGDMCDQNLLSQLGRNYDFAVLRDVIEHIENKNILLRNIVEVLEPGGKLFITFPPYYSPFGGHTQILQSKLGQIPFMHYLPKSIFRAFVKSTDAPEFAREEVLRLKEIRTTISEIEDALSIVSLNIVQKRFYAIRPTFHIRYGMKPKKAIWGNIPLVREIAVTAAFYFVEKK